MAKTYLNYISDLFDDANGAGNGAAGNDNGATGAGTGNDNGAGTGDPQKRYTDEDVDRIINAKFAKWKKETEERIAQAEARARLSEEERQAAELKDMQDELNTLRREKTLAHETNAARQTLTAQGITVPDEILEMLIGEDHEKNALAVEAYAKTFRSKVDEAVKQTLSGKTPASGSGTQTVTKEQILAVTDPIERQKLIKEHMDLFRK